MILKDHLFKLYLNFSHVTIIYKVATTQSLSLVDFNIVFVFCIHYQDSFLITRKSMYIKKISTNRLKVP